MTEPEQGPGASARVADPEQEPDASADTAAPEPTPLPWMPKFIAVLGETGNVRHSARMAGISQTTAYTGRKNHSGFADAWDDAITGKEYGRPGFRRQAPLPPAAAPTATGRTGRWRSPFLEALAETSSVIAAAALAGVTPQNAYHLRRTDPKFAAKWLAALHEGYDNLEMELLGYLRDPSPRRKMDVAGALRLLAAHRATVERRRALEEEEDEQAVRESLDAFLEGLRQRRLANQAILIEADSADVAE